MFGAIQKKNGRIFFLCKVNIKGSIYLHVMKIYKENGQCSLGTSSKRLKNELLFVVKLTLNIRREKKLFIMFEKRLIH